ncbi:PstS family phosphate ABC transporter substrate-binding protein [Scytonema tolypothrichoides VB-61278]|nr:PstS family phosphate ABC transporter substrate-binding protein [Scytonema tolypothrichoides VB-61278]
MNARLVKLAVALGTLALTTSSTTKTNALETQESQKLAQVSNPQTSTTTADVRIDGSSTVYPITQAIAKQFESEQNKKVSVNISGTSGGFEKFCAGQTDISNASRPILKAEIEACRKNGVRFIELPIAFDALTIVVHPQNNWAKDITTAELKKMWEPAAQGKITSWNQVRASWPNRPLKLFGAGNKSGTFDYFTEATVGKTRASRTDYTASEDDEVIANGVSKDPNALGYFGYAYYEEHKGKLKVLAVDSGKGAVLPSRETVEKAKYQPLSRPLFIYVNPWGAQNKEVVYKFVNFYVDKAPKVASSVGYVPLPTEVYRIDHVHLNNGKVGTVFGGEAQLNLTLAEVLRKQKQF